MLTRRMGGMTEFIPSPKEKREGSLRDHGLDLLANLDQRLRRIEQELDLPDEEAKAFSQTMSRVTAGEEEVLRINQKLIESGEGPEQRNSLCP